MDSAQRAMIEALAGCTFFPGGDDKRFVGEMFARTRMTPAAELSPRQDWYLRRCYYRYRRQLRQPNMPKPDDYDSPPPPKVTTSDLKVREANGEIIVCKVGSPNPTRQRQAELTALAAWNAGQARKV